jgi:hypothetical protein
MKLSTWMKLRIWIYLTIWLNGNIGSVDEKYPTLQMDYNIWIEFNHMIGIELPDET